MNRYIRSWSIGLLATAFGLLLGAPTSSSAASPASSSGVATVQVASDFRTKPAASQNKELARLWQRFQQLGLPVTRFDVVEAGTSRVIFQYSLASGVVAVP